MVDPSPVPAQGPFGRLGRLCGRRCRWVIAIWLVALVGLGAFAPRLVDELTPGGLEVAGSTSDRARQTIDRELTESFPAEITLVVRSDELAAGDPAFQEVLRASVDAIRDHPLVGRVVTPADDASLTPPDGRVAFVRVGITEGIDEALREADTVIAAARAAATDLVSVDVTGSPAIFADFNTVNAKDLKTSEIVQLPLVILILVLVLGSLVAAGLPIATTLIALVVTLGGLYFVALVLDLSIYVQNVVPLVGIGVAVDYSLFVVNRFREELREGREPLEAAAAANATAGRAIFFSGITVAVALSGMLVVGVPLFTGFAVGTIAVVIMAVLVGITLLPALLVALGHRVFKVNVGGRILRALRLRSAPRGEGAEPVEESTFWERWAEAVMRRPWTSLLLASAVLLALATPALTLDLGTSGLSALPSDTTSARATAEVAAARGPGAISPIEVVIESRETLRDSISLVLLATSIAADPETVAVQTPPVLSDDGRTALLRVFARHDEDSARSQALVGRIEDRIAPAVIGLQDARVSVGGGASQNRDFTDTVARNLPKVIGLVMLLTFLVLVVLFRSLLLPLKAVVMTTLSALAAYGVLVMVFQWGWGAGLLGVDHLGHVTSWVPPFLFSILFGLSMDYEVFLLSRVRERRDSTGDEREAVAWGLSQTGPIITAAALIMIVVFLSFFLNRLIPIKEASLGLAVAILLDATLVRVILVPAFMRLAGRWNWWLPRPLERMIPRLDEGELTGVAQPPVG